MCIVSYRSTRCSSEVRISYYIIFLNLNGLNVNNINLLPSCPNVFILYIFIQFRVFPFPFPFP